MFLNISLSFYHQTDRSLLGSRKFFSNSLQVSFPQASPIHHYFVVHFWFSLYQHLLHVNLRLGEAASSIYWIKNQKHGDKNVSMNNHGEIKEIRRHSGNHRARKPMNLGSNLDLVMQLTSFVSLDESFKFMSLHFFTWKMAFGRLCDKPSRTSPENKQANNQNKPIVGSSSTISHHSLFYRN